MPDTSKLGKLNRELEKSEKKLRKAINDEKALQHQLKQLTRKERTHRLCTRGGMADAGSYDERYKKWRYEELPILPQTWKYAPTPGKEKQLAILKELLHRSDVSEVVNGCDAGREGELIFRFVYEQAGCTKPFSRLWISSMEDSAIREGFAGRRAGTEYDALYQSALCRARADWLVGINATRLFSVLYHKTLNVGRVLSPTLNLLVERDGKITMFHKEKYHIVHIGCGGVDAESERISDAAAADTLRTTCEASQAVCVSLKKEKKTALPPKLFDLTCLQREANRVYGFTAKQTLDYAQSLYEKRFLTYPRTDSNYLTEDMAQTATDLVAALLPVLPFVRGAELVPEIGRVINSAKVSDHHAIIPTAAFAGNGFDGLPESEKKFSSASGLYSLHLSDAARGRAELELAKKLIDDYCREEFHSGADFSDLSAVGIGHTTVTDDEVPIQAYANLTDFHIEKYLGDVLIESRPYESLAALIQGELNDLEFDDLTYASDEQLAMFHDQEEASGKEAPSLDPAVQPVVTILWSESDKLQEGERLPLARADALFKALDDEKRSEREKPGYTGGWYDKTKFRIDCTFHGERDSYEGRQDFGDGDGALIDHIQAYHEYYAKDENWKNFVLHNEGTEAWEKDKAKRETLLAEFVPYMRLHCNLSEQERTAADMLENGEALTPEQTAYFHAVLAYVDACREKLNAGDYHLPDPPQLSDFDKELQDYKAHVESEIAQEAEAAGMTVEEHAANGYEPQEQPADVQEQPEEAPPADTAPEQTAVRYYTINEGAARRANDANSYRDYAAGSATAEYRQMVDQAAAIAQRQKERVDPMYHEKIDALLDTYARKLAENLNDHYAIEARVPSILVAGGSNFPVRKKEKQNAARDRNMQEWQDVQGILDKIRSTGMGGISMDDPQAAAKLEAKLVKLESAQETMKAVNAYFRKNKTLEGCPSLTPEQITKLQQEMSQSWHLDKSRPYPAYMLSNNNAEIRRIRGRIEQVRQHEDTHFAGWEFDGGRVEANKADNRLQVFFDGKPDEAARDELKANGFRWAPSVGAWQRQLNKNAYYAAGYISCIQPISGEKPIDVQRSTQQQESAAPDTHLTGERVSTPRGSFHVANMTREQMEAAGYGYHHSTDDGKYLIMGNGTQAFAIASEQREQENYMRTAELSTEQNYNMIDGQINNIPSVDELEEKAKRGEVISLSALAAAVKTEDGRTPQRDPDGKKPSIRAQLKANRAQSGKPQQREKEQEAKRSIRQALEME